MRISDWSADVCSSDRAFYDAVLGFLGYRRSADYDHGSDWDRDGEPFHSIGIVEARGAGAGRKHDRYSPGLHHLAWAAESREDVDALHDLLRGIGATIDRKSTRLNSSH